MNDMEIHPTAPSDLNALAQVLVDVHATDGYPVEGVGDPRSWLVLPDALGQWTALLEGRPVGHIALLPPAPSDGAPDLLVQRDGVSRESIAVVARLFVSPRARGRAIGRSLLETAEDRARESRSHLVLDVMAKDEAAINLYKSQGWSILGPIVHVHGRAQEPALALAAPPSREKHS